MKNSIRHYREQKGLTQKQLGDAVDLSDKTVSLYEKYDRPLPREFLSKVATVIGVPVEQLESEPPNSSFEASLQSEGSAFHLSEMTADELKTMLATRYGEFKAEETKPQRKRTLLGLIANLAIELQKRIPLPMPSSTKPTSEAQSIVKRAGDKFDSGQKK